MSPIKRMTSACSSAGDRSSRFSGGDMPLQNLKSLHAKSLDLPIFTQAVSPMPPTAAASKTDAAPTFAPITIQRESARSDGAGFPDYRHPGGGSGWFLDPPGAAI